MRARTTSSRTSTGIMDQDYTMDNWEEKIGNGDNVLAQEVNQRGGDVQPFYSSSRWTEMRPVLVKEGPWRPYKGPLNSTWAPSSQGGAHVPCVCDVPCEASSRLHMRPTEVGGLHTDGTAGDQESCKCNVKNKKRTAVCGWMNPACCL
jgi:hypothetical protein